MREIKFRAWDKRNKQMSKPLTIRDLVLYEHHFESYFPQLARFNDLIWLEYTGLKDKNGKEIYEGDIVRHAGLNCLVYWEDDEARYRMKREGHQRVESEPLARHNLQQVKVIGNIYENPELLEVK